MAIKKSSIISLAVVVAFAIISNSISEVRAGAAVTIEQANDEYRCVLERKPRSGPEMISLNRVKERIACGMKYKPTPSCDSWKTQEEKFGNFHGLENIFPCNCNGSRYFLSKKSCSFEGSFDFLETNTMCAFDAIYTQYPANIYTYFYLKSNNRNYVIKTSDLDCSQNGRRKYDVYIFNPFDV